jgi:hypothetical protein
MCGQFPRHSRAARSTMAGLAQGRGLTARRLSFAAAVPLRGLGHRPPTTVFDTGEVPVSLGCSAALAAAYPLFRLGAPG